jgi:predicted RNase H-like HicB family nuclease
MLTDYIQAAMRQAKYKLLEDKTYFGEISQLSEVWSHGDTLEECRNQLQTVLEEWIVDQLYLHHSIPPVIDGISLDPATFDPLTAADMEDISTALEEAKAEGTLPWEQVKVS